MVLSDFIGKHVGGTSFQNHLKSLKALVVLFSRSNFGISIIPSKRIQNKSIFGIFMNFNNLLSNNFLFSVKMHTNVNSTAAA